MSAFEGGSMLAFLLQGTIRNIPLPYMYILLASLREARELVDAARSKEEKLLEELEIAKR